MKRIGHALASLVFFVLYIPLLLVVGYVWLWLIATFAGIDDTWWARNAAPYIMTIVSAALSAGILVWAASAIFKRLAMRNVVPGFVGLLTMQLALEAIWRHHHPDAYYPASYLQQLLTALAGAYTAIQSARQADHARGL